MGLSPQARGNPVDPDYDKPPVGPIPAGAGEPAAGRRWHLCTRAYPRRRGGTSVMVPPSLIRKGLSPQARGNPIPELSASLAQGPIPAGAGEPASERAGGVQSRAYPRRRGGTACSPGSPSLPPGLSPQARGNLRRGDRRRGRPGPIPAGAGEPYGSPFLRAASRAYPRRRGGTFCRTGIPFRIQGLSPQARGNRPSGVHAVIPHGPIPAGAGEPGRPGCRSRARRAYPRRRGGTDTALPLGSTRAGLSPQARGNLTNSALRATSKGPIPAGAGEPL